MIGGITTLIHGTVCITMISGVGIASMISGAFAWKNVAGHVRDTSILDVVVVFHEVASVDLVDRICLLMR